MAESFGKVQDCHRKLNVVNSDPFHQCILLYLEYSSEVWDNCGQVNSDRLEKLQLEAARIVTGFCPFTITTDNYA
jgi:hypothetical protein